MKTWLRVVCLLVFVAGPAIAADLTATSRSPVHPVLIRNEHNPLLQVIVEAKAEGTKVTSLTFSLDGTLLSDDVVAVRLYFDGSRSSVSTKTPIGDELFLRCDTNHDTNSLANRQSRFCSHIILPTHHSAQ